jgi:hypothetical protein
MGRWKILVVNNGKPLLETCCYGMEGETVGWWFVEPGRPVTTKRVSVGGENAINAL